MSFSVRYDSATHIIEVLYGVSVSNADLKNAVRERISTQDKYKSFSVLIDCSQVKYMQGGFVEIHNLSREIYVSENADKRTRHALIQSIYPKMRAVSFHYETACVNRSWTVKIFEDRQNAIEWLLKK